MGDLSNTQFFQVEPGPQISAKDILDIVYKALKEKGYNPVNQIVGILCLEIRLISPVITVREAL